MNAINNNALLSAIAAAEEDYLSAKASIESFIDGGLGGLTQEEFDAEHERLGIEERRTFNKLHALKSEFNNSFELA